MFYQGVFSKAVFFGGVFPPPFRLVVTAVGLEFAITDRSTEFDVTDRPSRFNVTHG